MPTTKADKWNKIYSQQDCKQAKASRVVVENAYLLPASGRALDLACGMGGNAILLAQSNLTVNAWDISSTALDKLSKYSQENNLNIVTREVDVEQQPPEKNSYDVVVVSQFLHRPTFKALCESLYIGGILFYQTFSADKVDDTGPTNPDFLLAKNELLNFCKGMQVLVYREEGAQGDKQKGWRNQAMIVAKKMT
ncbi:MAG: class I SAM-dependent methyltransferase [Gammaproteobacteria bacterium]|nr:class I SAM-dependent methyltransferase [Gammaproteobacteria bacterium]